MAEFSLKLTQGGAILLAKAKLGKQLNFKYITLGSGVFEGNPQEATSLVNKVIDLTIQEKTRKNTVAFLKATLTYNSVPDGFVWTELGVIAIDPDTQAEVLYMYDAIDMGEVIPPATSATQIEKVVQVASYVSNAQNVTAVIDESLINIPRSDVGKPNGVAGLDENGVLDIEHGGFGGKTVQEALYNLGARPNPNLFRNPYFIGGGANGSLPINQQGKLEYTNDGYSIDAWSIGYINVLRINPNNISIFIDAHGGMMSQIVPDVEVGKTYTLSVFALAIQGECYMGAWSAGETKLINGLTTYTFEAQPETLAKGIYVLRKSQQSELQSSAMLYAGKLEWGDKQTLMRKVSSGSGVGGTDWEFIEKPDYFTELLKCQRYYQVYSSPELRPAKAIDCRPVMRIDPTQTTIQIDGVTYYVNDANL